MECTEHLQDFQILFPLFRNKEFCLFPLLLPQNDCALSLCSITRNGKLTISRAVLQWNIYKPLIRFPLSILIFRLCQNPALAPALQFCTGQGAQAHSGAIPALRNPIFGAKTTNNLCWTGSMPPKEMEASALRCSQDTIHAQLNMDTQERVSTRGCWNSCPGRALMSTAPDKWYSISNKILIFYAIWHSNVKKENSFCLLW